MSEATLIRRIQSAAKKRAKADAAKREATEELRRYCKAAQDAGVSVTRIASEAGLSRQGVYDLLGERLSHSRVEVAFARDWDLKALVGLLDTLGHEFSLGTSERCLRSGTREARPLQAHQRLSLPDELRHCYGSPQAQDQSRGE
jgi:hypothetical protein